MNILCMPFDIILRIVSNLGFTHEPSIEASSLSKTCKFLFSIRNDLHKAAYMIKPRYPAFVTRGPRSWIGPQRSRILLHHLDFSPAVAIAGSYALHAYMMDSEKHWPSFYPKDIDIFIADKGDRHWCFNLVKRVLLFTEKLNRSGINASVRSRLKITGGNVKSTSTLETLNDYVAKYDKSSPTQLKVQNTRYVAVGEPDENDYYHLEHRHDEANLAIVNVVVDFSVSSSVEDWQGFSWYQKISFISSHLRVPGGTSTVREFVERSFDIDICKVVLIPKGKRANFIIDDHVKDSIRRREFSVDFKKSISKTKAHERSVKYQQRGFRCLDKNKLRHLDDSDVDMVSEDEKISAEPTTLKFCPHHFPVRESFNPFQKPAEVTIKRPKDFVVTKYTNQLTCHFCRLDRFYATVHCGYIRQRGFTFGSERTKLRVLRRMVAPTLAFAKFKKKLAIMRYEQDDDWDW